MLRRRPTWKLSARLYGNFANRQLSDAHAAGGEDGVDDSRWKSRGSSFTHSPWRFGAVNDVNVNARDLVDIQRPVIIEIALFDTPILQSDFAMKRRR